MIKINLLHSQYATAHVSDKTGETAVYSEKTVATEARKSRRMFRWLTLLLVVVFGGSALLYMKRYEAVAFVEQYTGPLNLLAPVEPELTADQIEETRREKVRQLYMTNTYRIQNRDFRFLKNIDSLRTLSQKTPLPRVASVDLEGNDFTIVAYGKSANDLKKFPETLVAVSAMETVKPSDISPSTAAPGYRFKTEFSGTLRVTSGDSGLVQTRYAGLDKARQTIIDLAAKYHLKAVETDQPKVTKGVVMNKHRVGLKIEGQVLDYLRLVRQINQLSINVEQMRYQVTYAPRKGKPDAMALEYNVLIPVRATEAARSDTSSSHP